MPADGAPPPHRGLRAQVREHDIARWIEAPARPTSTGSLARVEVRFPARCTRVSLATSTRLGRVRMVDVGDKPVARRRAVARGDRAHGARDRTRGSRELPKGDALATAQLAGIMAAKRTAELIPLCHPLPLTHVDVDARASATTASRSSRRPRRPRQTGVEMEALTAASRRRADRLRHGEGDRQGDGDHRRRAGREDEGRWREGGRADRLRRGLARRCARTRAATCWRSSCAADGYEVERRVVPDEATRSRRRSSELAARARRRAHDRRHRASRRATSRPRRRATVLERQAPGIDEAMRADSIAKTPHGLLSRGVAGIVGRALVVNLPGLARRLPRRVRGAPAGARHALALLAGDQTERTTRRDRASSSRRLRAFARSSRSSTRSSRCPFAYVGAFLAVDGVPSAHDLVWITVAMVGARSLAMALNRLIDAGIDAAQPAHGRPRAAARALLGRRRWSAFCVASLARLPRRVWQLDPLVRWLWPIPVVGVRHLPVPEAVHLALPLLARRRRRARADRRLGGGHAATCPGRPGRSGRASRRGSPASTSSTRSSTSRSTASRACTRARRASASAARFAGARVAAPR